MTAHTLQSTISIPEPPTTDGRVAVIFRVLGLSGDPFPLDPAAGAFVPTSVHARPRAELLAWIATLEQEPVREDRLSVVVGEEGTGKTRLLTELVAALGADARRHLIRLPDAGEQPTEAQMLRSIAVGLGASPTGRTGLDLMGEIGNALTTMNREGTTPGLLIDGANFTGSRLETIRNVLRASTGSGLWIVLFGTPDLLVRTNRRRSLRGLMGPQIQLRPLTDDDARLLLDARIASVQADPDGPPLIEAEATVRMIRWAAGNAGKLVQIVGEAVVEAIAQGQNSVDARIAHLMERELTDEDRLRARSESRDPDGVRPVQATMPLFDDGEARRSSPATTQQGLWHDEHS